MELDWLQIAAQYGAMADARKKRASTKAKESDMLASKPKIVTERATSRGVVKHRLDVATSMNDILESVIANGLMNDPLRRAEFQRISSVMNKVWQ